MDFVELVFRAAIATADQLGPLPDNITDVPSHVRMWCRLIRRYDPKLQSFRDDEIREAIFLTTWLPGEHRSSVPPSSTRPGSLTDGKAAKEGKNDD